MGSSLVSRADEEAAWFPCGQPLEARRTMPATSDGTSTIALMASKKEETKHEPRNPD